MIWVWYGAIIGFFTGAYMAGDLSDAWHEFKMWRLNRKVNRRG